MKLPRKTKGVFALASVLAVLAIVVPGYGARAPVEQPLVREGDFAIELAKSLNLSTTDDETQAESILAEAGIAPRNGWMADYPVTPDIVSEIHDSVKQAAKSGRIATDENAAARAVQRVLSDVELPLAVAGARTEYDQTADFGERYEGAGPAYDERPYSAENDAPLPDSPEIDEYYLDDYYYEYGPPVVSYYAPPFDYAYLYTWVPWPFWWGSSWFGGYFVLNDFNIFIGRHHHWRHKWHHHRHKGNCRVSNHTRDANGRTTRIDPANRLANVRGARPTGTRLASVGKSDFQRSGRAIVNREATRGPRTGSVRSAPSGNGSSIASNGASSGSRNLANQTGRNTNTGRTTALNRQHTGQSGNPGSARSIGSVGRNTGRTIPGYGAPRTSVGNISPGGRSDSRGGGFSSGRVGTGGYYGGVRGSGGLNGSPGISRGGSFQGGGVRSGGLSGGSGVSRGGGGLSAPRTGGGLSGGGGVSHGGGGRR